MGAGNRATEDPNFVYEYDDEGRRTKRTAKVSGNPTGEVTEYEWGYDGRLLSVTILTSPTGHITSKVEYGYNSDGERVYRRERSFDAVGGTLTDSTHRYAFDGGHVVAVADANGVFQTSYLYGPGTDAVLAVDAQSTADSEWLLANRQGTVTDSVERLTSVSHMPYASPLSQQRGQRLGRST